ncbi:hypothetical protein DID88_010015 [Monilinia fructigena]|uniref:Uncharacterized protein n=1 Tax=Monilinia fructigena TaxID=38457 RepID=A0A395IK87_9HELO|nr:hypothetical protein DID88_010015 [Monilinia fructigena]
MRPTTPNFNFAQSIGPSSPPETPTHPTFTFATQRQHMNFFHPSPKLNGIIPNVSGPHFSYHRPEDLSPRSTSPSSESSGSASPPRSESSQCPQSPISSPIRRQSRVVDKGNFTVEEITESDLEDYDCNEELIIRPHQYEDAESDRGHTAPTSTPAELDPHFLDDLHDLTTHDCPKITKHGYNGTGRKDVGDVAVPLLYKSPDHLSANEAGSSARRLRRKTFNHGGDKRASLIFDDPPPRIPELEEPDSCEEVIEDDTELDDLRELPYCVLEQTMDVDSSS